MIMLKSSAALLAAVLVVANAQSPSPFYSFGGGGGGPPSPSPFNGIGPSSSPYGRPGGGLLGGGGRPGGFPGSRPQRPNSPSKLFSWLGSTMSKLPGLVPKIHYHSSKPKPSSLGGLGGLGGHSSSAQNAPPTYFSSGGPPRESLILPQIPNSIYDGSSSPFGGNGGSITFGSPNAIDHPRVNYNRSPLGPPPSGFGSRPGPQSASPFGSRPYSSFGSRPAFSFASGSPSFSTGGPPSYSSGRPSQFSPSPYPSSDFGGSPSGPRPYSSPPQGLQNNLEVFPSQQVSYQSETLSQNQPGYNDALSGLQNLYGSQSSNKPSFSAHSMSQQQTSYSQPQQVRSGNNNYGANFHSIEPVRVAPIYDVAQHFKSSSPDLNGAGSNSQRQQQQTGNIHDTPFASLVNDYSAQADAATAGSNQMISALQAAGSDLMSSATNNQPIPGVQILGGDGNPMFEVMAGPNAPTFDGHPIDLNRLISMIEPGAQIDTIPNYGGSDAQGGSASEQQPVYAEAPSNLELESEAAMSSGSLSGNKNSSKKLVPYLHHKSYHFNDKLEAAFSESRPTVLKLDGTRLNDDSLIKEHFDKDLILDDALQGSNEDTGFIIVGVKADEDDDNQTGDYDDIPNGHLQGTENSSSENTDDETIPEQDDNKNNINDKDMLAIIKQLRDSAAVVNSGSSYSVVPSSNSVTNENNVTDENSTLTTQHPNHNYNPAPIQPPSESSSEEEVDTQRDNLPKINPIFDSVRPGRTMSIRTSVKSSTSVETDTENNDDQDSSASTSYHRQLHLVDKDIDDEDMLPDSDLFIDSEDDMAASASRNVKSVAIIVTPPPHYVRIKNKYKKAVTPLSALTSTTTPLPLLGEDGNAEEQGQMDSSNIDDDRDDDALSESVLKSSNITVATTPSSSLEINSSNDSNNEDKKDEEDDDDDSMMKIISGIVNGRGISEEKLATIPISSPPSSSSTAAETAKRPRLYPVYRGKSSS